MALLQPKLNLKVSQRQVLTPGLMQMVSVLALNKLELKEMIDAELVENPVLEEIDESVPMLDEVAGREEKLERSAEEPPAPPKDAFEEIDFGSYFQDYLDPGYRTQPEYEESERPSFENFLSQPTTLADHLEWQLGAMPLEPALRQAAEFVIGNLDEDGYLTADEAELAEAFLQFRAGGKPAAHAGQAAPPNGHVGANQALLRHGIELVQQLDPAGVGARDLRECLAIQIRAQQQEFVHLYARHSSEPSESPHRTFHHEAEARLEERRRSMEVAAMIVDKHLALLQRRDAKELSKSSSPKPNPASSSSALSIPAPAASTTASRPASSSPTSSLSSAAPSGSSP